MLDQYLSSITVAKIQKDNMPPAAYRLRYNFSGPFQSEKTQLAATNLKFMFCSLKTFP